MADDLGVVASEVHAKAHEVVGFWFEGLMPEQHFAKADSLDREIRERFQPLRDEVLASGAEGWRDDPETLLAAVLVLDQFSRNIYRSSAEAFGADALARELTLAAIERGWADRYPPEQRQFVLMPLMHAEDRELQALSLRYFAKLGLQEPLDFAHLHADVIARFGRFPGRNAALGRISTPEEVEYLSQPGVDW